MRRYLPKRTFDKYDIERFIVMSRNRILTAVKPKGDTQKRKIFVIGHARTGTTSLHALFQDAGISSRHSAGNWYLANHDAFSDRGDYRPIQLYRRLYPNAMFVLNTRTMGPWVKSMLNHRRRIFSQREIVNLVLRRNKYFADTINLFEGDSRLVVCDITKVDAFSFIAEALNLPTPEITPHKNVRLKRREGIWSENFDRIMSGPIGDFQDYNFIIPQLLDKTQLPYSGWQCCVRNNFGKNDFF
jgi:hypothetical protein